MVCPVFGVLFDVLQATSTLPDIAYTSTFRLTPDIQPRSAIEGRNPTRLPTRSTCHPHARSASRGGGPTMGRLLLKGSLLIVSLSLAAAACSSSTSPPSASPSSSTAPAAALPTAKTV